MSDDCQAIESVSSQKPAGQKVVTGPQRALAHV